MQDKYTALHSLVNPQRTIHIVAVNIPTYFIYKSDFKWMVSKTDDSHEMSSLISEIKKKKVL